MKVLVVLCLALVGGVLLSGCAGYDQKVAERFQAKVDAWKAANPEAQITEALVQQFKDEAVAEIREEMAKSGVGILTSIFSGNWLGAIFYAIGLGGVLVGAKKGLAVAGGSK